MSMDWSRYGFQRVAALKPEIELGRPFENAEKILQLFSREAKSGALVITTPELALTGYTCEDLFHSEELIRGAEEGVLKILHGSSGKKGLWILGAPLRLPDGRLLNGAFVIHAGKLLGFVPKTFLPNMGEYYERRWFVSGRTLHEEFSHPVLGALFVSPQQLFCAGAVRVGIEICHDLWAPEPPSTSLALRGANLLVNLSASNELTGKAGFRRRLVEVHSRKNHCAYLYSSCGTRESSKDTVYSGHTFAFESGTLVAESAPFDTGSDAFRVDFDFERILNSRTRDVCFLEAVEQHSQRPVRLENFAPNGIELHELMRTVDPAPFLSEIPDFSEVIGIQAQGLLRRAESARAKSLIVGVSGGLDSTHALRVAIRARELSGEGLAVIGVTLPGPGTSRRTLELSRSLLREAAVDEVLEVAITDAVAQHLKDLGKTDQDRSVVFENAQARERTQILFDLANERQGIVVGTGDLSELALGWCTFNADHMAHYAVNSGVPKTVVKALVAEWAGSCPSQELALALRGVLDTPISPELLPPGENGEIAQETEALIGNYELHDFFLHALLSGGFSKEKILVLSREAFRKSPALLSGLDRAHSIFFQRFFSQQFKRTTLPPGPKVHSVSLSPRSDFRLPDELKSH
jgi:NAD+ synthase (glutamine-hydrolysing)